MKNFSVSQTSGRKLKSANFKYEKEQRSKLAFNFGKQI